MQSAVAYPSSLLAGDRFHYFEVEQKF